MLLLIVSITLEHNPFLEKKMEYLGIDVASYLAWIINSCLIIYEEKY